MRPGIVVGLVEEGRIARRLGLPIVAGGGTAAGAEVAAEQLIAEGAAALLSIGLCGGLDPALRPGAIMVPRLVLAGGLWRADAALTEALGGATADRLLGAAEVAATVALKRTLWETTKAAAVDLESGAVARAAVRRRIPFAVLRVVCDPAERALPAAALAALTEGGEISLRRVLLALLARPAQLAALWRLASDARAARGALRRRVVQVAARSPFG